MQGKIMAAKLEERIEPLLAGLSLELVDLKYRPGRKGHLYLYIDKPGGATLGDCEQVSREVSLLLDASDPIPGHYILEVSTPGVERPLKTVQDYRRFSGEAVKIYRDSPEEGRKILRGVLRGIQSGAVLLELEEGGTAVLPLEQISRAHLWYRSSKGRPASAGQRKPKGGL